MALAWLVQMLPEPLRGYLTKEDETGLVAQWLPLVLMVAAMIVPAIYSLLFGKKQPRTFLNPTEWKVLPLMNKEVRLGQPPFAMGPAPCGWPLRHPAAGA